MPATHPRPIHCIVSLCAALCFIACAEPDDVFIDDTRRALVVGPCADCGPLTVQAGAATAAAISASVHGASARAIDDTTAARAVRAVRARLRDDFGLPDPDNTNGAAGPCFGCRRSSGSRPRAPIDSTPDWPEAGDGRSPLGAPLELLEDERYPGVAPKTDTQPDDPLDDPLDDVA